MLQFGRIFYRVTWAPVSALARKVQSGRTRENFLGIYGPLSLIALLTLWIAGLILSFGLLQWGSHMQPEHAQPTFANELYFSATTLFTLSSGDPVNWASKCLTALEGGLGLSMLGLVIGYLPVFYQSFSRRELAILLLSTQAGSPPSAAAFLASEDWKSYRLERVLMHWEKWSAELLENQISYPMLAYFRSQHQSESWLTTLVAILDSVSVILSCGTEEIRPQAELTFAMSCHAMVDIARVFWDDFPQPRNDRLSSDTFGRLQKTLPDRAGACLKMSELSEEDVRDLRRLYEPYAEKLAQYFLMTLPEWAPVSIEPNKWRPGKKSPHRRSFSVSDPFKTDRG